jgi:hypothetical protein
MMRGSLLPILLCSIAPTVFAQSDSLFNGRGTYLGTRSGFLVDCKKALGESTGGLFDLDRACPCIIELILTFKEIDQARTAGALDKLDFEATIGKDTVRMSAMQACMTANTNKNVPLSLLAPELLAAMEGELTNVLKTYPQFAAGDVDVGLLSRCFMEQLVEHKLTLADLSIAQDVNSPLFNELMVPCGNRSKNPGRAPAGSMATDLVGPVGTFEVPAIALERVHKVKVRIGGVDRYFVIDSGANDCFISVDVMKELLAAGAVMEDQRLTPRAYVMADGTNIICDRFNVSGLTIGEHTLNNVVFATMDKNFQFLLGKSALDKFTQWSIDAYGPKFIFTK